MTCPTRTSHFGVARDHLYTGHRKVTVGGEVVEDVDLCSWCGKVREPELEVV